MYTLPPHTLTIHTPEGISFSYRLAGPVTRFLAWSVDTAAITAIMTAVGIVTGLLGIVSRDMALAANMIGFFIVSIGYGIALEWFFQGQTLGKRLLRLRVMDERGLRLQPSQVVLRNLLRFVDSLPGLYFLGGLASLLSPKSQRLGDMAANTIVIWQPPIAQPDLSQLLKGKYNSFSQYPHLAARLRQNLSPAEAQIALQALLRRDGMDPDARIELFADIAEYLKTKAAFPPEATDGLSDEQYVRNAVDISYRTH